MTFMGSFIPNLCNVLNVGFDPIPSTFYVSPIELRCYLRIASYGVVADCLLLLTLKVLV